MARDLLRAVLLGAVLAMIPTAPAAADHMEPDPSFGEGGRELFAGERPTAAAGRPAGGAVLARPIREGGVAVLAVTAAGSPDPSFGDGGRATVDVDDAYEIPRAVLAEPGGGLIVVGSVTVATPHNHLADVHPEGMFAARLDGHGRPDRGWGSGGVAVVMFPDGIAWANAVAAAGRGRTVLAGAGRGGEAVAFAMLDARGRPDPAFGNGGLLTADVADGLESARGIASVADSLVVAGSGSHGEAWVLRLRGDGTALDPGFGDGGVARVSGGPLDTAGLGLLADDRGRLLVPGRFRGVNGVLALDSAGRLDRSFGADGIAALRLPVGMGVPTALRAALDPSGGLFVSWTAYDGMTREARTSLERFDPAGRAVGSPSPVSFADIRLLAPVAVAPVGAGGALIVGRAIGVDASLHGALVRLRPGTAHARRTRAPARRRRCRRHGRPAPTKSCRARQRPAG